MGEIIEEQFEKYASKISEEASKLEKKVELYRKLRMNYGKLWNSSDEELQKRSRKEINYRNTLNNSTYKKISSLRSKYLNSYLSSGKDPKIEGLLNLAHDLFLDRKMDEETYKIFENTPKEVLPLILSKNFKTYYKKFKDLYDK
jgi:hypothetical protein